MKYIFFQKLIRYYLFVFFSLIIFKTTQAQLVELPKVWKFMLGDNMDWAGQSFNGIELK